MRQSALVPQPVVRLLRKLRHRPRTEEIRPTSLRRCLFSNRLGSVFTVFVERAILIRIRPRTSRTIDSVKLVEMSEGTDAPHYARFFECEFGGLENGLQPCGHASGRFNLNGLRFNRRLRMVCAVAAAAGWPSTCARTIGLRLFFLPTCSHIISLLDCATERERCQRSGKARVRCGKSRCKMLNTAACCQAWAFTSRRRRICK